MEKQRQARQGVGQEARQGVRPVYCDATVDGLARLAELMGYERQRTAPRAEASKGFLTNMD